MVEGVGARGCVGGAVPTIVVACGDDIGGVVVDADREVQRVGTGAAEGVSIGVSVYARSGIGGTVPSVVLAGILIVAVVGAVVEGEVEGDGAVATLGVES